MRENVLGLTAVMADGRLVRTGGRARKSAAGYDLTRLLVGSEGTLGIITEVCVRLARLPEAIATAVCPFPGIEAAAAAVIELISSGIRAARSELLDEIQIDAVNRWAGFDHPVTPTLFLEFHGSGQAVAEQAAAARAVAARPRGLRLPVGHRRAGAGASLAGPPRRVLRLPGAAPRLGGVRHRRSACRFPGWPTAYCGPSGTFPARS